MNRAFAWSGEGRSMPCQKALEVDELVAGSPEVVHDLGGPAFNQRPTDPGGEIIEDLVPRDALPPATAPRPLATQRVADALGVVHLVERRGTLRAVPAAASGMGRVPLELLDAQRGLVHVGEKAARGLAVEADRRDQRVTALHLAWPGGGIVFLPVLPALDGRVAGEPARGRRELSGGGMERLAHDSGRAWPALSQRSS